MSLRVQVFWGISSLFWHCAGMGSVLSSVFLFSHRLLFFFPSKLLPFYLNIHVCANPSFVQPHSKWVLIQVGKYTSWFLPNMHLTHLTCRVISQFSVSDFFVWSLCCWVVSYHGSLLISQEYSFEEYQLTWMNNLDLCTNVLALVEQDSVLWFS